MGRRTPEAGDAGQVALPALPTCPSSSPSKAGPLGRAAWLPQPRAAWPVQAWGGAWAAGGWGPISLETWAGSKTGSLLEEASLPGLARSHAADRRPRETGKP